MELDEVELYEGFNGRLFHRGVNTVLLKDEIAAGAKPISLRSAYNWLHKLGFRWMTKKKQIYVDGHERPDVVMYVCLLDFTEERKIKKYKKPFLTPS